MSTCILQSLNRGGNDSASFSYLRVHIEKYHFEIFFFFLVPLFNENPQVFSAESERGQNDTLLFSIKRRVFFCNLWLLFFFKRSLGCQPYLML